MGNSPFVAGDDSEVKLTSVKGKNKKGKPNQICYSCIYFLKAHYASDMLHMHIFSIL
jgi:hypothetical protein